MSLVFKPMSAVGKRVILALCLQLPACSQERTWHGGHGLDIDHARDRLYAACDDGHLVEVDSRSGDITNGWPIAGPPDVTFFNPESGRVHVAIGEPGLVETIEPKTGKTSQTVTGAGAHTTVLVPPDRLYVIFTSPWWCSCTCRHVVF